MELLELVVYRVSLAPRVKRDHSVLQEARENLERWDWLEKTELKGQWV